MARFELDEDSCDVAVVAGENKPGHLVYLVPMIFNDLWEIAGMAHLH